MSETRVNGLGQVVEQNAAGRWVPVKEKPAAEPVAKPVVEEELDVELFEVPTYRRYNNNKDGE